MPTRATPTEIRAAFRAIATEQRALSARLEAAVLQYALTPASPPPEDTEAPTPQPPAAGPLEPIKIKGNQIVGATTGKRIIMRGTNFYGVKAYPSAGNADGQMGPVNAWHQANADGIAKQLSAWGANCVRLLLSADPGIIPGIKKIHDANAANGIYTWLATFDNSGFGGFTRASGTKRGQFLARVWSDLNRPASLWMNLANEPNGIDNDGWRAFSQAGVEALRGAGYAGPIMLDTNVWAHATNFVETKAIGDPQVGNAFHAYAMEGNGVQAPSGGPNLVQSWTSDQSVCCMTGEWGPYNLGRFGGDGSMAGATSSWCKPMSDAVVQAVKAGRLAGNVNWMELWDGNSQLEAKTPSPEGNRDWWGVVSTPFGNHQLNSWGQLAQQSWAACAAINT